jgi:hypothetical protein
VGAAIITASLWAALGRWWWMLLAAVGVRELSNDQMVELFTLLWGWDGFGYLLAVTVHYVLQASDASALSERRVLEAQIAQRMPNCGRFARRSIRTFCSTVEFDRRADGRRSRPARDRCACGSRSSCATV